MHKFLIYIMTIISLLIPIVSYSANDAPIKTQKEVVLNAIPENHKSKIEIKIEAMENECMGKNQTQAGMNNCAGQTFEAWDKALNDVYGKLMKKLDKQGRLALKNAQREWLKYRDSHFKFLETYYEKFDGSMYVGMRIQDKTEIIRDRTLILQSLLLLTEL